MFFSCASKNYSHSERIKNNSFAIYTNVQGASVSIKPKLFRHKESFNYTSVSNGNGKYVSQNTFEKLKFGRTILVVSRENYEPKTVKVWRVPRGKAFGRDFLLGLITYGIPLVVDPFRSDFYKVASWSKNINVELKFTQEFMNKKYHEIENSITPEPFIAYIKDYPYSNVLNKAVDKKDSTQLLVALDKSTEIALDDYIASHQKSKFLKEASNIKAGVVEARVKFEETKSKNTAEAYEAYLANYPKSLQKKDAINRLVDVSFKNAVFQNKLESLLSFNNDYLLKYQSNLNSDTINAKTDRLAKLVDKQIIKENDTDPKNKYLSYSKVWKKYNEIIVSNKNLIELKQCKGYLPKISNLLLVELTKLTGEAKQNSYLKKAESDFPVVVNSTESETPVPFVNLVIDNAVGYSGSFKLYNQKYIEKRLEESSERDVLKALSVFVYKGEYYANYKEANVEEITLKNGEISNVKLYNGKNLLLTGNYNGSASSECSFYLNGKLVRTNYSDKKGYYFYEFENGVNLSLKELEEKIKRGDLALSQKNYDYAIDIFTIICKNDYPATAPLNVKIRNSIANVNNQKNAYLQKLEKQKIAEEKRQEQLMIAEERKQEQLRLAENKKRAEQEKKNEKKWPERTCSSCHESFCCHPGYTIDEYGNIKELESGMSWICSYTCMSNLHQKLNNFMDDNFETCDNCNGVGKVSEFSTYSGWYENVTCRKCRGSGKIRKY